MRVTLNDIEDTLDISLITLTISLISLIELTVLSGLDFFTSTHLVDRQELAGAVGPVGMRVAVAVALFLDALDSASVMLDDTHVVEGLGDETVARTRGVHGAQQQLHRHIERELTGTGDGDRIVVDAQLDVVRGTVVAMADGVRERFAQGLDGIIPDGIVIHLAGRVHDGTADVALDEGHGLVDLILNVALEVVRIKNLHSARLERTGVNDRLGELALRILREEQMPSFNSSLCISCRETIFSSSSVVIPFSRAHCT